MELSDSQVQEINKAMVENTSTGGSATPTASVLSRNIQKKRKKQERSYKNMLVQFKKNRSKALRIQRETLDLLKRQLGKQDFNLLKSICTVQVPEQKDKDGKVTQEAKSILNKKALILEARHLLVLLREERIKSGLRKRSSGSSSDRRRHHDMIQFLTKRNKEASKELEATREAK